jgi:hypothetical protein
VVDGDGATDDDSGVRSFECGVRSHGRSGEFRVRSAEGI